MSSTRRPGLNEMRDVITAEADRIYGTERARQKLGEKPIAANLRKVEVLDAAGDLLAKIIPVIGEVSASVKKVAIQPCQRDPL